MNFDPDKTRRYLVRNNLSLKEEGENPPKWKAAPINILTFKVLVATIDALGHFETG